MSREVDRRDPTRNLATASRREEHENAAREVSDRLPGEHRVSVAGVDPYTGNPVVVTSTDAPAGLGSPVERALEHVQSIGRALGMAPGQPPEFVADPNFHETSSGAVTVHLRQQYKGIPVFEAAEAVSFDPDDKLRETWGAAATFPEDLEVAPRLTVEEAVRRAAEHVAVPDEDEFGKTDQFGEPIEPPAVDLGGFKPKVRESFADKPDRPTVLEPGPFEDAIRASLLWFPLDGQPRLTWDVLLTLPGYSAQYRTIVDADTGEILYCRQTINYAKGRANVFRVNGGGTREMVDLPEPLESYGLPIPGDLPAGFPDTWVAADRTDGNSVTVRIGLAGQPLKGKKDGDTIVFNPNQESDDQKVVNLFYFNCRMHDFFYLLGFREKSGNFQQDNFDRGGAPGDPVSARVHSGAVPGTANFLTLPDGISGFMNMGLVSSSNRHTALDSTIVYHEFSHGVTNRLVGGPQNVHALQEPQSGGMGEGWGDYFACTLNNTIVVGSWVMNKPGGMRAFPYDSNYPDNFGDLGTGRYTEVHNIGEIWCATLMEMNRNIGIPLALQLVVDALKLSPINPSFLDMRDAILIALSDKLQTGQLTVAEHDTARAGIWKAFGKFGMGVNARSNGATLTGIVADFSTEVGPTPEPPEPPLPEPPQPMPGGGFPLILGHLLLLGHARHLRR